MPVARSNFARWMDDLQTDAVPDVPMRSFHTGTAQRPAGSGSCAGSTQLDHPARVIAFPAASRPERHRNGERRVALSWVGVAAAAGLAIGVVGGQVSARLSQPIAPATTAASVAGLDDAGVVHPERRRKARSTATWLDDSFETVNIPSLRTLELATPRLQQVSAQSGG